MLGWYERKLLKELVELIHNDAVDEAMYAISLKHSVSGKKEQKKLLEQYVRANDQLVQEIHKKISEHSVRALRR